MRVPYFFLGTCWDVNLPGFCGTIGVCWQALLHLKHIRYVTDVYVLGYEIFLLRGGDKATIRGVRIDPAFRSCGPHKPKDHVPLIPNAKP